MALTKRQPALPDFILAVHDEIDRLCRAHHVTRLELFGSATGPEFDPETSDVDLLVEWDHEAISDVLTNYFGFRDAIAHLVGHPVELASLRGMRNPYLRDSVDSQRVLIYES